jgi:hypothetical protein
MLPVTTHQLFTLKLHQCFSVLFSLLFIGLIISLCLGAFKAGLWIRIDLIRIRIQHF